MAQIIDGKLVSKLLLQEVTFSCARLKEKGIVPGLTVIIVGDDPASKIYVANKGKACRAAGINSREYALPAQTTQEVLLKLIAELSADDTVDGILVQLPLPGHIDEQAVINAIPIHKDVDAFHPANVGKIMIGNSDFLPCTPAGVMEMLRYYQIDPSGKECVVLGRSNIVGKPMAMLLLHANGTVTICHSKTKDLKELKEYIDGEIIAFNVIGSKDISFRKVAFLNDEHTNFMMFPINSDYETKKYNVKDVTIIGKVNQVITNL